MPKGKGVKEGVLRLKGVVGVCIGGAGGAVG